MGEWDMMRFSAYLLSIRVFSVKVKQGMFQWKSALSDTGFVSVDSITLPGTLAKVKTLINILILSLIID
jgi:hypothetical protein